MRVYLIPCNRPAYPHDTEGNLYDLQAMVGGYIETVYLPGLKERGIILLANEEGLLSKLPTNINLFPFFFVGHLVAIGVSGEEFVSLTPDQESYLKEWLENLS